MTLATFSYLIREKGECVCSVKWNEDSGYPPGKVEHFYKFKNEYWFDSEDLFGPADSLAEAMEMVGIVYVESIDCTEMTAAELAKRLPVVDVEPGYWLFINGEGWEVSPEGKLEKCAPD